MDVRVCYVLADGELGRYADMACISAASLRRAHPDREIILLCDVPTAEAIRRTGHPLQGLTDSIVSAAAPHPTAAERSRWLKTSLRTLVPGHLLYLDVDTVVVRPVELPIASGVHALAAADACDHHGRPVQDVAPWVRLLFDRLGWTLPGIYRNAGVVFFRDTREGHAFGERWHTEWSRSAAAGCHRDQPAFNAAVGSMRRAVGLLPLRFNAMPTYRPRLARGAAIYHFWAEQTLNLERPSSLLDHLVSVYARTGAVDHATIEWCRRHNYPWMQRHGIRVALRAGAYRVAARALLGRPYRAIGPGEGGQGKPGRL
jgi:hypothetical protein